MKDSKNSFEQMMWANAARFHAEYSDMLKTAKFPAMIDRCLERIAYYEQQFPQLKVL